MPPQDKLEESTVTLIAKVVSGKIKTEDCTFKISYLKGPDYTSEYDAQEVAGKIVGGSAKHDIKLPKVRDDDDSYLCKWKLLHEGTEYDGPTSWKVWPRSIKLTTKSEDGSKTVANVPVSVSQQKMGAKPLRASSDGSGIANVGGLQASAYTAAVDSPFEVVSWKDSTGRAREVWVRHRPLVAQFVSPKPPASGKHKQYVNLAKDKDVAHGNVLTVQVEPKEGTGQKGDKIFIKVTFGRESKRNSPEPKLKTAENVTGPTDEGTTKVWKGEVTLKDKGTPTTFEVELGQAGGDTCKIEISGATDAGTKSPFPKDEALEIENWRQLHYQLTLPAGLTEPDMSRIRTALAQVHIEYAKYKTVPIAEGSGPAGSWHPAADLGLGGAGKAIIIGDHNKDHFHKLFKDDKKPLGVHVLYCHKQFDGGTGGANVTALSFDSDQNDKIDWPAADTPGFFFDATSVLGGGKLVLPTAMQDGQPGIRGVRWRSKAAAGPHKDKQGIVFASLVRVNYKDHKAAGGRIWIRLPAEAVEVVKAGEHIDVSLSAYWALGEYLGESDGAKPHLQLINGAIAVDTQNDVMAHELGHTLGMVAKPSASIPGIADLVAEHGFQYTARGHQGQHCGFGLAKPFPADMTGKAACKCILYGENSGTGSLSSGSFCEKCRPLFKGQAFTAIS